ncbi:uncharacterized protein N7459_007448 [Penicillium hispanicum]|uniref:uncharacterized protein n=1 Tax=Penicillium hispanicum TaxID=1080232 RepID=UPI0025424955|nr:uncharacterized protein N7459_007448 [Penicillium hispanicum]KAJ5578484.1 hypothetical protein N7459_007448 [Penicillium hispanicum]
MENRSQQGQIESAQVGRGAYGRSLNPPYLLEIGVEESQRPGSSNGRARTRGTLSSTLSGVVHGDWQRRIGRPGDLDGWRGGLGFVGLVMRMQGFEKVGDGGTTRNEARIAWDADTGQKPGQDR